MSNSNSISVHHIELYNAVISTLYMQGFPSIFIANNFSRNKNNNYTFKMSLEAIAEVVFM